MCTCTPTLPFLRLSFVVVIEAVRQERERVSAALLLWKLHTQGKAFAALAAHRLRRLVCTARDVNTPMAVRSRESGLSIRLPS